MLLSDQRIEVVSACVLSCFAICNRAIIIIIVIIINIFVVVVVIVKRIGVI
jgi:hypothetical protein